jgi:hypothetical protein
MRKAMDAELQVIQHVFDEPERSRADSAIDWLSVPAGNNCLDPVDHGRFRDVPNLCQSGDHFRLAETSTKGGAQKENRPRALDTRRCFPATTGPKALPHWRTA